MRPRAPQRVQRGAFVDATVAELGAEGVLNTALVHRLGGLVRSMRSLRSDGKSSTWLR
jgi:hypothetical protein